ncbi:hypothetical protein Tco_0106490, partial [Tanacetum coccineum]
PVRLENQANKFACPKETNHSAGIQDYTDISYSKKEAKLAQEYCVLPSWSSYTSTIKRSEAKNGGEKPNGDTSSKTNEEPKKEEKNEEPVNAAGNIGVSTVNISTADRLEVSTATPMTPPTTTSVFDNEDITLAETLVKMKDDKAKLKGVAIKEVEESDRPVMIVN